MPQWTIENFNGGISTGKKRGIPYSFYMGRNLDLHSNPDELKLNPKTTKDSGTTIVDLPLFMTSEGVNNDVYALGSTGRFYKRTATTSTWSNLRTLGGANGEGLNYFNNLIYFSSNDNLGTYNPATGAFNESYHSLNSSTWHPMVNFGDKIFIGNGQYIAYVDGSGIWKSDALVLGVDYRVTCIEVAGGGEWVLIGTERLDGTDCKIYRWDGTSTYYNDVSTIRTDGVNAIINSEGIVLISAGSSGDLYQHNGNSVVKIKKFPKLERNETLGSYPGAVCNFRGDVLMGTSFGTAASSYRGVYSWASAEKNYSKVLNMDYTISTGTYTGTGLQIGSLFSEGANSLYIGWKDGTSYGIDLVDGSGVFAEGTYESLIFDANVPYLDKNYKDIVVKLAKTLATGETITVAYDIDRTGTYTTAGTLNYSVDGAITSKSIDLVNCIGKEFEIKLTLAAAGSTSPIIDSVTTNFLVEDKI